MLDKNIMAFVVHICFLSPKLKMTIYATKKVIVPDKYSDFANVFLEKSANVLPNQIGANEHAIKL